MANSKQSLPVLRLVYNDIADEIRSLRVKTGQKLLSERELSEKYSISRMTARRVYEQLERDGLVYRWERQGWFVSYDRLQMAMMKSVSFINNASAIRKSARATLLKFERGHANESIRSQLKVRKDQKVIIIRRIFYLNDIPSAIETMYMPDDMFPNFSQYDLTKSILSLWQDIYGILITHVDATLRGEFLSGEDADLLGQPKGSPAITLVQTMNGADGESIAYNRQDWRFELAEFIVTADFA